MISAIAFFFVLIAGSVFAGVYFRKDFGDYLPFSTLGIILVMYVSGLLGFLKGGVYLILAAAGLLLLLSVIRMIREKRFRGYLRDSFGISGLYFILLYIAFLALNYGRLAWHFDEMTHWMDCVKAMSFTDEFAANEAVSHSPFASYPPGMALLQYFFQKLHLILDGTARFDEWRAYTAFQVFCASLSFPMLKKMKYHSPVRPVVMTVIMLVPMIMYSDYFTGLLIDPVLGVMAGTAFVYLLMAQERSYAEKAVYISMLCAVLTLMKDAGIFFSVFISIGFILYTLAEKKSFFCLAPMAASLGAWGSWRLVLQHFHTTRSFSEPIHIGEYLKLFFIGGDTSYRQESVDRYKEALIRPYRYHIHEGITTSYIAVLLVLVFLLGVMVFLLARNEKGNNGVQRKRLILLSILLVLQTVLYAFFLGAVYAFTFIEEDALELSSFDRYLRIGYLPLLIAAIWMTLSWIQTLRKGWKAGLTAAMAAGILLLCPFLWLSGYVTRASVQDSAENRESYRMLQESIETQCSGEDSVAFISNDPGWYNGNLIRMIVRPNTIEEIKYQGHQEDEEWIRTQILDQYPFVVTDMVDDETAEMFREYICGDETLQPQTLYKVKDQMLERVSGAVP